MAIFKRQADTGEQTGQPDEANGSVGIGEPGPEVQPVPAVTPEAVIGSPQPAGNLPAALEPELRRIIDTAVARVAAIELEAIREARHLTERSEHEARDALRFALDRGLNLISSLELLAATVNGMAEALKTELDDAIVALRNVSEPQSELAEQLMQQPPPPIEEPPPPIEEEEEPEPQAEDRHRSLRLRSQPTGARSGGARAAAQGARAAGQADPARASTGAGRRGAAAAEEPAAEEHVPERQLVTSGAPPRARRSAGGACAASSRASSRALRGG